MYWCVDCPVMVNFITTHSIFLHAIIDIDECREAALESSVICTQANTQCLNTNGSFECVCVGGYEPVDGECERKGTAVF